MTTPTASTEPTRRERQRQATYDEIVDVARALLRGGSEVSLRAVAGEMGLTPPALYRYVDGASALDALVTRQIFVDVVAAMARARDAVRRRRPGRPDRRRCDRVPHLGAGQPRGVPDGLRVSTGARRRPARALVPAAGGQRPDGEECAEGESLFTDFFGELFYRLWDQVRFPAPSREELEPGVVARWESAEDSPKQGLAEMFGEHGVGVLWLFELAWARLYGIVTLEVFGHMDPQLTESGALFRATILEIGTSLGLAGDWERLRVIAGYPD